MSEPEVVWHLSFWCYGCKKKCVGGKHKMHNPRTKRSVTVCDACKQRNAEAQREWKRVLREETRS